ncbi:hypothetical protein [Clostridium botulinum]|uniref:Tail fiber protein n=1 Tax=Clostridium botulinum TaxID=1491 RepID=A0A6G4H4V9_CLOBO|nr:hypothetical protein [Clostridium botulinum]MBY6842262.1 hypothetical protein [Clostridium botulinum]MBY6844505.1 hypothetical protein [Clostridium botulinum]NFH35947.1 hypothetical protein [Clostridium botulinum]NFU28498.1 hypothetical protein [Clostridium botulinum]NFV06964.1 hypothetical protein [Clostridium botulinum]
MEKSFVFNSVNGDRRYKAEDFREYFASFIGNGVFPNPSTNLQVIANSNMTITIKQGKAWLNGAIYINTDDYILNIDVADGVLNRIDRVVLRMDTAERKIYSYVKKGQFASSPVAPTLQRDADAYELALADVAVNKGAISITQANITDLRLDKNLCGIVHGTVDQIDVTTLFNQYSTRFKIKSEEFEKEFEDWLKTLKDVLGEDTAGNLLNLITKNTESINNIKSDLADITTDTKRLTNAKDITGAINELFTNANNGKKLISDVVGNPLLATDTFQQQNDKIQSLKNALVSNLNVKGQVSSNAESLKSLIDKVLNINTGRKSASGKQDQKNLINGIILEVSDLDFKPSIIFLYVSSHLSYNIAYSNSSVGFKYCYSSGISSNYTYAEFPLFIKSDGFRYENFDTNFWDIRWLAIE